MESGVELKLLGPEELTRALAMKAKGSSQSHMARIFNREGFVTPRGIKLSQTTISEFLRGHGYRSVPPFTKGKKKISPTAITVNVPPRQPKPTEVEELVNHVMRSNMPVDVKLKLVKDALSVI